MMSIETPQLLLSKNQRSHILFVFSNPSDGSTSDFIAWYTQTLLDEVLSLDLVIGVQHFSRHEVDITMGHYPPPDYGYLSVYELSIDGAEQAAKVIAHINERYENESSAGSLATWLYYPSSEKVGRVSDKEDHLLTLAFANATKGNEQEFREWYCTRHIRHALYIPVLVSGQCFERAQFQQSGQSEPEYQMIAMYEQEGSPKEFLDFCNSMSEEVRVTLQFPTLDATRFGECAYYPVTKKRNKR